MRVLRALRAAGVGAILKPSRGDSRESRRVFAIFDAGGTHKVSAVTTTATTVYRLETAKLVVRRSDVHPQEYVLANEVSRFDF